MKKTILSFLLTIVLLNTNLFAQVPEYYWVGDQSQGGNGHWDTLSNWRLKSFGIVDMSSPTPSNPPDSSASVYIKNISNIQHLSPININADSFWINKLTVDIDSLEFAFDKGRVNDSIYFEADTSSDILLKPYNESESFLESSPVALAIISFEYVTFRDMNFLKTDTGILYMMSNFSLYDNTYMSNSSGTLAIIEGSFLTMGKDLKVNQFYFQDSLYTYFEIGYSDVTVYGNNGHSFENLDSLSAANSVLSFQNYDESHSFVQLHNHNYAVVQLNNSTNIYGSPTIQHLELNAGKIYILDCQRDIHIDSSIVISGNDSLYTLFRSEIAGDSANLYLINASSDTLKNLIVKDVNLHTNDITLSSSVDLGGNSSRWEFKNSPQPKSFYYDNNQNLVSAPPNWSDLTNWHNPAPPNQSSYFSEAERLPLPIDTVVFDHYSFLNTDTIFLNNGMFYCHDMIWLDMQTYSNPPVMMLDNAMLYVSGSMDLDNNMTISSESVHDHDHSNILFTSDSSEGIKTSGNVLNVDLLFHGQGSWELEDNLNLGEYFIEVERGTFISDGYRIFAGGIADAYEESSYNQFDAVIDIRHSFVRLTDSEEPSFNINRATTKLHGEGSHIVLASDTAMFNGGNSKFGKLTSKASFNRFLSSDTFNLLRVNAGSSNGIADSITINRNFFIEDTSTNATQFWIDSDNYMITTNAKIINNSINDICFENVDIMSVDVISNNLTTNYVSASSSYVAPSCIGWTSNNVKCYMNLMGSVKDDSSNAFSNGQVVIFKLNPNSTAVFDTLNASVIDSMGNFMFNNLSPANYMLKADPRPATGFMPAYCPDKVHWSNADTLALISDTSGIVITVRQPPAPPSPGNPGATITGKLDTTEKSPEPYLNILSDMRAPSEVFDSIVIGLIRPSGDLVMLDTTDNNGFFTFNNVPNGQYRLLPDIAGIEVDTTGLNNINISSATDSFNYLMEVDSNDIYVADTSSGTLVSTTFLEQNESVLKLWPNPVRGQLNIVSEEYIREIRLYDQLMREISIEGYATGSNQYLLDLSGLKRGIYLLRINGMNVKHRILKL